MFRFENSRKMEFAPADENRADSAPVNPKAYTPQRPAIQDGEFPAACKWCDRAVLDLSMARNAGDLAQGRIHPDRVTVTLAVEHTTLFAQVTLNGAFALTPRSLLLPVTCCQLPAAYASLT